MNKSYEIMNEALIRDGVRAESCEGCRFYDKRADEEPCVRCKRIKDDFYERPDKKRMALQSLDRELQIRRET